MRNLACIFFVLCFFNAYSKDDSQENDEFEPETEQTDLGKGKDNAFEPEIEADVSDTAVQNAVSFDGAKGLAGFGMTMQNYGASIKDGETTTTNSMSMFHLTAGLDYAKSFKKGLLLSVCVMCDISKKKRIESNDGDWRNLNESYDDLIDRHGLKNGFLETGMFTPSLAVKCGYNIKSQKLVAFLKLGVSRLSLSYNYILDNVDEYKHTKVKINAMVPTIGIGAEKKINKKLGCIAEINFPIKRKSKVKVDGVEHTLKAGGVSMRIMLSLALQNLPKGLDVK
ncbi:hypothetical protein FACS1894122_04140 [Alphaproteobacteria bacterium]|nr:hypothetical protein FACS1894122_04140 [Alphaproteobacteria bacterium]